MSTETYHQHITHLNAQIAALNARIVALETDAAWRIQEHDAAIENYQDTIETLNEENGKLAARVERLEYDIDVLETENAQLEENAPIVASRLYGAVMVVSNYPDAYLIDLRGEE